MPDIFDKIFNGLAKQGAFRIIGIQGPTEKREKPESYADEPVYPGTYGYHEEYTALIPQKTMDLWEKSIARALEIYLPEKHFLPWAAEYVKKIIEEGFHPSLLDSAEKLVERISAIKTEVEKAVKEGEEDDLKASPQRYVKIHEGLRVLQEEPEIFLTVAIFSDAHRAFLERLKNRIENKVGENTHCLPKPDVCMTALENLLEVCDRASFEDPLLQIAVDRSETPLEQRKPISDKEFRNVWSGLLPKSFKRKRYFVLIDTPTLVRCPYRHRAEHIAKLEVGSSQEDAFTFSRVHSLLRENTHRSWIRLARMEIARSINSNTAMRLRTPSHMHGRT
jgi:hypothetical protein